MTNGGSPAPSTPLSEVLAEVSRRVVADRLESILPGLERHATEQGELGRQRRDAVLARRYPELASRVIPPEALVLSPDCIVEHARQCARIESDQIGEDQISVRSDANA